MEDKKKRLQEIFQNGTIYLVTQQSLSGGRSTEEIVEKALKGGARMVQLRDKDISKKERLAKAHRIRKLTGKYQALFFVDDEVDIAVISKADGVHLGQDDLPLAEVRKAFPGLLIGVSTHNLIEAKKAIREGADYINIGPIFPTKTKIAAGNFLGLLQLRTIGEKMQIPFTVMGGINKDNLSKVVQHGARICAMVTAITQSENIEKAVKELTEELKNALSL